MLFLIGVAVLVVLNGLRVKSWVSRIFYFIITGMLVVGYLAQIFAEQALNTSYTKW